MDRLTITPCARIFFRPETITKYGSILARREKCSKVCRDADHARNGRHTSVDRAVDLGHPHRFRKTSKGDLNSDYNGSRKR
jgi:hypothetical protein